MAAHTLDDVTTRAYEANVRRFYVHQFLANFQLWMPFWVVFLQVERGLSLTQVALMETFFHLTIVASEMPTGAVADRWGRKVSLLLGGVIMTVAVALFGLGPGFWWLVVSYLAWGLAWTLQSGADTAFVYDSLAALGREAHFTRVAGRGRAVGMGAALLAGAVGAPLAAATSMMLAIGLSAVIALLAALVVLTFREPAPADRRMRLSYVDVMGQAVRHSLRRPSLRTLIVAVALLEGTATAAFVFSQPFLTHYGVSLGLFGLLVVPSRLLSMAGSLWAHRWVDRVGEGAVLYAIGAGLAGAFLVLAAVPSVLAYAMFPVFSLCWGTLYPVANSYLSRHSPQHLRATVVSLASMGAALLAAGAEPLLGFIADDLSLRAAFLAAGLGVGVLGGAALAAWTAASRAERPEPAEAV